MSSRMGNVGAAGRIESKVDRQDDVQDDPRMKWFLRTGLATQPAVAISGLSVLMMAGCSDTKTSVPPPPPDEVALGYSKDIEGIVSKHCLECHGVEAQEAELDLRTLDSILVGGESGPAIVPWNPEQSILVDMIHNEHMPPEGEVLTPGDIDLVRRWIASGALP